MGEIVTQAATVYRDKVSPGSAVDHEPVKSEIRDLFATVERETDAASSIAAAGVVWNPNIVRVRSTGNVAISSGLENGDALNGVTLATGDIVFLGSQSAPAENGLYTVVASGSANRSGFADAAAELAHIGFVVREGTVGAGEQWTLPMDAAAITVGSTSLVFALIGVEVDYATALNARVDEVEAQIGARMAQVSGGTANEIQAQAEGLALTSYNNDYAVTIRLDADVTDTVPTLAIDGLDALEIYDSLSALIDLRLMRAGNYITLRYSPAFGGIWNLIAPIPAPKYSASAMEGLQRADEAASGARRMLARLRTAGVLPTPAFNPTPLYDQTYSVAGSGDGIFASYGTGPSTVPTDVDLVQSSASGGYLESTAVAEGGDDSWWWDWNHVGWGPGFLQLLAVFPSTAAGGPLPNIPDLRGRRVTIELQAINLYLPNRARLMFHWQGPDLSVANGGTGKTVNYHWHEPLDVALGSLGLSKAWPPHPNSGTGRLLNGTATVVIDFEDDDSFWRCIGTSEGRIDAYAAAPVERVMRAALTSGAASSFVNMHLQVIHPQQYGHSEGMTKPPLERAYGTLRIKSFKIEAPV